MQVKIVRHDRGAEDTDRDVQHVGVGDHLSRSRQEQIAGNESPFGIRKRDFDAEQSGNRRDESDDERLQIAKASILEQQKQQHIRAGEDNADYQRNMKKQ